MVCHQHPSTPAVAHCSNCGQFVCQRCARLQRPVRCSDCALEANYGETQRILWDFTKSIVAGLVTLVVAEILVAVLAPGIGTAVVGAVIAYTVAGVVLGGAVGPLAAPWVVATRLFNLHQLRNRKDAILDVRNQTSP
jgi:hypothetical protein